MPASDVTTDFLERVESTTQWARDAKVAVAEYNEIERKLPALREEKAQAERETVDAKAKRVEAQAETVKFLEDQGRKTAVANKAREEAYAALGMAEKTGAEAIEAITRSFERKGEELQAAHDKLLGELESEITQAQARLDTVNSLIAQAKGV